MIHKCVGCGKTQDCEGRGDYCSECVGRIVDAYDDLVAGLTLAMEWLDPVCDPKCYDRRTPEGVAVHDKLVALLKEVKP